MIRLAAVIQTGCLITGATNPPRSFSDRSCCTLNPAQPIATLRYPLEASPCTRVFSSLVNTPNTLKHADNAIRATHRQSHRDQALAPEVRPRQARPKAYHMGALSRGSFAYLRSRALLTNATRCGKLSVHFVPSLRCRAKKRGLQSKRYSLNNRRCSATRRDPRKSSTQAMDQHLSYLPSAAPESCPAACSTAHRADYSPFAVEHHFDFSEWACCGILSSASKILQEGFTRGNKATFRCLPQHAIHTFSSNEGPFPSGGKYHVYVQLCRRLCTELTTNTPGHS